MDIAPLNNLIWYYGLYVAGLYGLLLETTHPGSVLPSVAGLVLLAVALYGVMGADGSLTGLSLVTLGVAVFAASFLRHRFWLWYGAGVLLFLGGTWVYFTQPAIALTGDWSAIILGGSLGLVILTGIALRALQRLYRPTRCAISPDRYLGQTARVTQTLTPTTPGKVNVLGETWPACLEPQTIRSLEPGSRVLVSGYADDTRKTLRVGLLDETDAPTPSTEV